MKLAEFEPTAHVWAAPIESVDGTALTLRLSASETTVVTVDPGLFIRYPQPGDYYVVNQHDYASIAPKAAFEVNYEPVAPEARGAGGHH